MAAIPSSVVDTGAARSHERFALWREALAPLHEAQLPDETDPASFSAMARGWKLGHSVVIATRSMPQILRRPSGLIRADQIDHYIVRLQQRGHWASEVDGRTIEAGAGTVIMLDLAKASSVRTSDIENINVIVPRDALDDLLAPFDMHGLILRGAMATLLRSHLLTLAASLPELQSGDAVHVANATVRLLAACLAPTREAVARAQAPLAAARLSEIRRYIDRHLSSPELSPQSICRALGMSRSTLYAVCEPMGGAAAFIQKRRLDRIHAILSDPRDSQRISEIAYQHGFVSEAHFSRAFRRAFGMSAREAREARLPRYRRVDSVDAPGGTYASWLRELRGGR